MKKKSIGFCIALAFLFSACSDDDTTPEYLVLEGKITDSQSNPLKGALVQVGSQKSYTDSNGGYAIDEPLTGEQSIIVSHDWCGLPVEKTITIKNSGSTIYNAILDPLPFKLDEADKTLAQNYDANFDWKTDILQISVLDSPTRRALDNAIYYKNPAHYQDKSSEPQVDTELSILDLADKFVAESGEFQNQSVILSDTAVNKIEDTPFTSSEISSFMIFQPMFNYLTSWDTSTEKIAALSLVRSAIEKQLWNNTALIKPQFIRRVYIHNDELWVEILFDEYIVTKDITDSDNDGFQDLFVQIDPRFVDASLIDELKNAYSQKTYTPIEMSDVIVEALNELYSTSKVTVLGFIGLPYQLPEQLGIINYPFIVLNHKAQKESIQVLLLDAAN